MKRVILQMLVTFVMHFAIKLFFSYMTLKNIITYNKFYLKLKSCLIIFLAETKRTIQFLSPF